MSLNLYDTFSNSKKKFEPIDPKNIRMYVCGPTVYDYPHVGNARPVIVFDILFRILQNIYGTEHVTYVRNITDVDDKIINASQENNTEQFLSDCRTAINPLNANNLFLQQSEIN